MSVRVHVGRIIMTGLLFVVLSNAPAFASGDGPSSDGTSGLFASNAAPLSAAQSATYAEAQSVAERNPAFSATGMGEGEGVTGLEVLGILMLIGLGAAGIAALAASN